MTGPLYARYGQWTSYVRQVQENLARANAALLSAKTEQARELARGVRATCERILAEMDALFPEHANAATPTQT